MARDSKAHQAMVETGRFDPDAFKVVFDEETGTGLGPEFLEARLRYPERVEARYQRVDLEILTPLTDQGEHPPMRLAEVFMPQHVHRGV
jgi:hypothetical protein